MNYLAHALLSPEDPLILMGNLWGDLLRPKDYESLEPGIVQGVRRHKAIDAFTDQHQAVDRMIMILRPYQGKYTPVVTDVLMDHILSKFWDQYHPLPLEEFCRLTYQAVDDHLHLIPERLHPRIRRMLGHQWLESCKNRERMEQTLRMLSKRASFENTIPQAMTPYDLNKIQLDSLFVDFFQDVQKHINPQNEG
jgi:acyl carrier protein phosphodiesterase